jgi:hypothetical protein
MFFFVLTRIMLFYTTNGKLHNCSRLLQMQRRENKIQSFEKLRLVSSCYFLVVVMEIVNHIILHSWSSCISFVGVGESFMFFSLY